MKYKNKKRNWIDSKLDNNNIAKIVKSEWPMNKKLYSDQ